MSGLISRLVTPNVVELVRSFRVVVINGPRQAGKTTLLHTLLGQLGGQIRSLDDDDVLQSAKADPRTFVSTGARPLIIDEVQRAGDPLVRSIKYVVDRDNAAGQFILSGSAQFLTVPVLSESLAGRAALVDIWPLSMAERTKTRAEVISHLFDDPMSSVSAPASTWTRNDYIDLICAGGFPEAIGINNPLIRRRWFSDYLTTVIERDIKEFADIHRADVLSKLMELIAARAGSALVHSDLTTSVGLATPTLRAYLSYLKTVFLYTEVRPWSSNLTSKVVKTPKAFPLDPGLAAHLVKASPASLASVTNSSLGALVETFVCNELTRTAAATLGSFDIYYFRDRNGREIDFILEDHEGRITAVEVKASASPSRDDARHLYWLKEKLGERLAAGVVFHLGPHSLSFGDRIVALPISALWNHAKLG